MPRHDERFGAQITEAGDIPMSRRRFLALAAAGGAVALAGCSGNHVEPAVGKAVVEGHGGPEPPSKPGKYGGKLTDVTISDPKSFNIWVSAETSTGDAVGLMYDALIDRNLYTLKFEGRLADIPSISKDGLTYTFKLKPGLQWSDGIPITADDVLFSLDLIFDPKTEGIIRESLLIDVPQPDGTSKRQPFKYRKVDDQTVEFSLPAQWAPWESTFSFPIAPKHKLEAPYKAGNQNSTWGVNTDPKELVGSGPWLIQEYVPRQRIVYKRNPHYWRKGVNGEQLPYLDSWVTLIVPDINTMTLKFRSGESDVLPVPAADYPSIKKGEAQGNYTVHDLGPGWGFNYLGFNMNPTSKVDPDLIKLFQDLRFRQAVSYAVNRDRMCSDIFQGLAQPLYGSETPANTLLFDPNVQKYPFDLNKAKSLLAEIGLKPDSTGALQYNGKPVKFNILTNTENEYRKSIATIISEDLRKIGLGAQFTPVAFNDLIRRLDTPPYDWEAVVMGITGSPEPNDGASIWRSSGMQHQWWPHQNKPHTPWEAEIDKLFRDGAHELDPAKRKLIYDKWQEIAAQQLPFIFTIVTDSFVAIKNHFGNLKPTALSQIRWNIQEIYDTNATRTTL